jgi:hypothetical protein
VGLKKSRVATGRERWRRGRVAVVVGRMCALWMCLARSRIWTTRVIVFNETTGVPLTALCSKLEFHGHYSKYRWETLSSPRPVFLLMLTSGLVSWATMVSEPASPLLGVGSGAKAGSCYLFILAVHANVWASHYFLSNEKRVPKILEPIKQHLKNHKNTNNSYLDI